MTIPDGVDRQALTGWAGPRSRAALVAAVGLLVVFNVANNRLLPSWTYVPVNLAEAATLVAVARWAGLSWEELGLARRRAASGLRWGLGALGLVLAVYVAAVGVEDLRSLFADEVAETASFGRLLYETLVRIPFGTVVLEEVAFRGVVLALALRRWRWWPAAAFSSLLFGLWHVLPAARQASVNEGFDKVTSSLGGDTVGVVLAAVVATAAAGMAFCWLRRRSGSLLAPILLHLGTNSGGFAFAWALAR